MKVAIYGAGGPVAAGGIEAMTGTHTLRLTDLNPMETEHEFMPVDITDLDQVKAAAKGMDVLINCTVNRRDPTAAFDVNFRGCYNVLRAAVDCSVPRVIHTGPHMGFATRGGYWMDHDLTEEAPPKVGVDLYAISKHLGWKLVETFARRHPELTIITFVYTGFYTGEQEGRGWVPDFAVDSRDAGQAFKLGVEVPRERLPHNLELFYISADLPMQRVSVDKARRILGYAPQHNFEYLWSRRARREWDARRGES